MRLNIALLPILLTAACATTKPVASQSYRSAACDQYVEPEARATLPPEQYAEICRLALELERDLAAAKRFRDVHPPKTYDFGPGWTFCSVDDPQLLICQVDFAGSTISNLSGSNPHDAAIATQIRDLLRRANYAEISQANREHGPIPAMHNTNLNALFREALYVAMNYLATKQDCQTRSGWFMLYASTWTTTDKACVAEAKARYGGMTGEMAYDLYQLHLRRCSQLDTHRQNRFGQAQDLLLGLTVDTQAYTCANAQASGN